MFAQLEAFAARPALYCETTTELLWADPHTSEHMLRYHLDGACEVASRTTDVIRRSVAWLAETAGAGARVLDLGCGPGLYANRLSALGMDVTGVDFSARSIGHARDSAPSGPRRPTYIHGNYLDVAVPGAFDVALMIYCDFCALDPGQRGRLLARLRTLLGSGGRFIFDVLGLASLAAHEERASLTEHPADGFWSPDPCFEFLHSFRYDSEQVTLDKYDLIEAHRHRTVYNWLQHYDPRSIEEELHGHGFEVTALRADLTGADFAPDGTDFAVVSTLHR